ncbi:MAG TPA: hypothetical protein VGM56_00235 [Byssovorax sp.]|jgi:hypothetical protein
MRCASAFVVLALLTSGCLAHPVTARVARPNPFVGEREFVLLPLDHTALDAARPAASDDPEELRARAALDAAVVAFDQRFAESMVQRARELDYHIVPRDAAGPGAFVIRPRLQAFNPGNVEVVDDHLTMRPVEQTQSLATVRVTVIAPDGERDEVTASHAQPASRVAFNAVVARSGWDGLQCGMAVAEHVKRRIDGE